MSDLYVYRIECEPANPNTRSKIQIGRDEYINAENGAVYVIAASALEACAAMKKAKVLKCECVGVAYRQEPNDE